MKITATFSLASIGLVSAFLETPRGVARSTGRSLSLRASDPREGKTMEIRDVRDVVSENGANTLDTRVPPPNGFGNATPMPMMDEQAANPKRKAPQMSQAIPFLKCSPTLDGALAGDVGFDPLGFADSYENLANYREAEVKHARLAMLAAAGWPLSELWDAKIANVLGMEPALNADGRVPSVLNGGMGQISLTYWLGCLALAGAIDVYGSFVADKEKVGYFPGNLGFDPLGLYPRGSSPKDLKSQESLQLSEIKHGRLAMLAITAFAAQEFVSHTAVVDHASFFFHPITDVLFDQQPGYYIPPEAISEGVAVVAPEMTAAAEVASSAAAEVVSSAAVEATAVAPEIVSSAAVEATAVAPEIAAPAAAEATSAAVWPAEFSRDTMEATTIVPPTTVAAPIEAAATTSIEELDAARARIVELEERLAKIDALIR